MIVGAAPGKLFLAGEYAVVEPGQRAVLVAVDRLLRVELTDSEGHGTAHSASFGPTPLTWSRASGTDRLVFEQPQLDYVASAIATVDEFRAARGVPAKGFDLQIESDLDDASGHKLGLGSSAAVTVATIAALNEHLGLGLSQIERCKLAILATIAVSPAASGGDVAVATFGGWVAYASPDREALAADRGRGMDAAMASAGWAPLRVDRLPGPRALKLLVGWTASPASTARLVGEVRRSQAATKARPTAFLEASADQVDELVAGLEHGDDARVQGAIQGARAVLRGLQSTSGITIETPLLQTLCETAESFGAAAKPSGAGGGDCGIAFIGQDGPWRELLDEWTRRGIRPLDLRVWHAEGAGHE